MTRKDDTATTWRDLTDQLIPEQIAYLENWEARPDLPPMASGEAPPLEEHYAALLFAAREYAIQNAAAIEFAHVPPPPDEGEHQPWTNLGNNNWVRYFYRTPCKVGPASVAISGVQSSDGSIKRWIYVEEVDDLDPTTARQLAAALIAAADELERLR